jgi:CRISPR-associated endonuclease Cas3-HD
MNEQHSLEPAHVTIPTADDAERLTALYAHSANRAGTWQPMADHLTCVAAMARGFASSFAAEEAELAGLLHDLGKYGDKFQRRLRNLERGLDHWSAGAWVALQKFHALAAAAAIQGHHIGLQQLDVDSLRGLDPIKLSAAHPLGLRLAEPDTVLLTRRLEADGLRLPEEPVPVYGRTLQQTAAAMLDVRMLFSALVDADFLDTEAHSQSGHPEPKYRPAGISLDPGRALCILTKHVSALSP